MEFIDLRSDAYTHPTPQMRQAILNAEVGDDFYGEDPTINQLEKQVAELLGLEAACMVISGTFGNLCAIKTLANPGEELILANQSHMIEFQNGGLGRFAHVLTKTVKTEDGRLSFQSVKNLVDLRKSKNLLNPILSVVQLQNPTTLGKVYDLKQFVKIVDYCHQNGIKVHLDGARLFNAATFLKVQPKQITKHVDSVMICLNKSLCSPMGGIVAGSKAYIDKLRYVRKSMGGGLRQAGFIAAAGLVGLKTVRFNLGKDHEMAQLIVKLMSENSWFQTLYTPDINLVFFKINAKINFAELSNFLKEHKILFSEPEGHDQHIRVVTHQYIREKQVEFAVAKIKEYVESNKQE